MKELILLCMFAFCNHQQQPSEKVGYKPYTEVLDQKEVTCLSQNIYFEAKGETKKGKKAIAYVTLNRLQHGDFPKSICSVVYERKKGKCQFSWSCKKRSVSDLEKYQEAEQIAITSILNYELTKDVTKGAIFFHKRSIKPSWTRKTKRTTVIGKHIFYKL